MGLDFDGEVALHDGDGRNVHIFAHDDGAGPLVDNDFGIAVGFDGRASSSETNSVMFFSYSAGSTTVTSAAFSAWATLPKRLFRASTTARGGGEIGALQLKMNGSAERDRRRALAPQWPRSGFVPRLDG